MQICLLYIITDLLSHYLVLIIVKDSRWPIIYLLICKYTLHKPYSLLTLLKSLERKDTDSPCRHAQTCYTLNCKTGKTVISHLLSKTRSFGILVTFQAFMIIFT